MQNQIPNTQPQESTGTRTRRQIAGAANGRLSAGAKSLEGLARSAANSTKHGLTSKSSLKPPVILFNESLDAYEAFFQSLDSCFQPADEHELTLVRRMAESEWLRQRAIHMESAAMAEAMRQQAHPFHENSGARSLDPSDAESLRAWHAFSKLSSGNPAFAALQRYAATHARAYSRAERELRDYRIAKAESIHPTPEPLDPVPTLEPSNNSQDRWQPLETIQPADEESREDSSHPDLESPETQMDETKVTPHDAVVHEAPPLATSEAIIVFSIEN